MDVDAGFNQLCCVTWEGRLPADPTCEIPPWVQFLLASLDALVRAPVEAPSWRLNVIGNVRFVHEYRLGGRPCGKTRSSKAQ